MYLESIDRNKVTSQLERIKSKDPDLVKEYEGKKSFFESVSVPSSPAILSITEPKDEAAATEEIVSPDLQERQEEAIAQAHFRPVLVIRDNQIVPEFVGPDVTVWKDRLMEKKTLLDGIIPAVGRVEVRNNAVYTWVGTGWLIDTDIIVTNRHVASIFCKNKEGFEFKIGFPGGSQAANMDFLEEFQRNASLEFDIESVLWIAENDRDQPDVAFMRIKRPPVGTTFPKPIPLADTVSEGEVVVTIGYPARDPDVPDQELVLRIFGNVYDKKRLAPGEVINVSEIEIEHDCSTLGGNSGSVVLSLSSGKAVGLHFAGLYMQGNYAVPAKVIAGLLQQLHQQKLPGMRTAETVPANGGTMPASTPGTTQNPAVGSFIFEASIPIKITLEIGGLVIPLLQQGQAALPAAATTSTGTATYEQALELARKTLMGQPGIISVNSGYRFRRGWITDERVIVVEVQQKLSFPELKNSSKQLIPQQFLNVGVDVRTAGLSDQLAFLGIDTLRLEAVPKPGIYQEPPNLRLRRVKKKMKAIFHVSPDSGWPNLKKFLGRVENKLTATMYEWEADHISDAIFKAVKNGRLKMVTQKRGTEEAVKNMKQRLGSKFSHVWASVGSGKIVPTAYHIKVASRDGKEFWLSSGNWKNSNQADIDPAGENSTLIGPLRNHNREWHVIIENDELATLFQKYIEWDFQEANRVPFEEALQPAPVFLFVPEAAFTAAEERRGLGQYFDPLVVDKVLDVQPLLTPDHNSRGDRMFLEFATELIDNAQSSIDIENQSFSLLEENEAQYERFYKVIRKKQTAGIPVRIIFRDPREFSATAGEESLQKILDRLKEFGIDTDNIKTQKGCHTKAIVVDSDDDEHAAVLFGSHNLTTSGALFNRDASLLVRDPEVAQYFQKIFNFDWEVLATQAAEESVGGVRIAGTNEETPPGFRKVSLDEFMRES